MMMSKKRFRPHALASILGLISSGILSGCSPQEEESGYRYDLVGIEQLPDTTVFSDSYYAYVGGYFSGDVISEPDPHNLNDFFAYLQRFLVLDEAWYEPSTRSCRIGGNPAGPNLMIRMKSIGGRDPGSLVAARLYLTSPNGFYGLSYCPGKTYRHYKF